MKDRRRMVTAVCSLTAALAVCAFAVRVPARTLNSLLASSAPQVLELDCSSGEQISSVSFGFTSFGALACTAIDGTGSTQHANCTMPVATIVTNLARNSRTYCSATAFWGFQANCGRSVSVRNLPIGGSLPTPSCSTVTLQANAWGTDP